MSTATDYRHILEQVAAWPVDQRLSLAQDIVATVRPRAGRSPSPRKTLERALGLFRGPQPPPDDDDVKRMLHDHRMEKYG